MDAGGWCRFKLRIFATGVCFKPPVAPVNQPKVDVASDCYLLVSAELLDGCRCVLRSALAVARQLEGGASSDDSWEILPWI